MFTLTLITALGCGLNAGIFFAFSSFIMRALGNLPPAQGVAAMQRINIDVINPWFMAVFMGTAALSAALAVWTLLDVQAPGAIWRLAGAALYLLGTFGVTIVFNVPLNNRLAKAVPGSPEADALWRHYLKVWTSWNTVRTLAPAAALAALILSISA
jgi:uncharacterized membrane protein